MQPRDAMRPRDSAPHNKASIPPALSLVIPLLNEAQGIRDVVHSLQCTLDDAALPYQLILVDNGSTDGTADILHTLAQADPGIEWLRLDRNAGYGGGILAGLARAKAPIIGYLWGDEQVGHHVIVALYRKLLEERLDLAKARRVVRLDGWRRRLVSRTYHLLAPMLFPVQTTDINGCPKLFQREVLEVLRPSSRDWFLDAEIMIEATRRGLRIGEIDVVYYPRETGHSKVRWSTLGEFLFNLARYRLRPEMPRSGAGAQPGHR